LCDNSAVREVKRGHHLSDYEGEDMRTFGTFLAVGILALATGCGGSSGTGNDGGGGATQGPFGSGGISGAGGAGVAGAGGGGSTGACNMPSCLNLSQSCVPSGTCAKQSDATTGATYLCYSNGVKVTSTFDASFNMNSTVKNGATTCYSLSGSAASLLSGGSLALKNGSGTVVGTLGSDPNTGETVVTCTGGAAVTLNAACHAGVSEATNCPAGTCAP
jgi:hypothetical protein